jgi:hypothetical protein
MMEETSARKPQPMRGAAMIIVQRRDGELTPAAGEAPRCERCRKLEAENERLREVARMLAALAGEPDLVESMLGQSRPPIERW